MRRLVSTRGFTPLEIKSYLIRKRLSNEAYQDTIRARFLTGFTMIELLTVIAIISVLTGLLLVGISKVRTTARINKTKATIEQLESVLEIYSQNWGTYPNDNGSSFPGCSELINALEAEYASAKAMGGPYVEYPAELKNSSGLLDPWGVPYRYHWSTPTPFTVDINVVTAVGQTGKPANITFNIWSYGPNKENNANITNSSYPEPLPSDEQRRNSDDIVNW